MTSCVNNQDDKTLKWKKLPWRHFSCLVSDRNEKGACVSLWAADLLQVRATWWNNARRPLRTFSRWRRWAGRSLGSARSASEMKRLLLFCMTLGHESEQEQWPVRSRCSKMIPDTNSGGSSSGSLGLKDVKTKTFVTPSLWTLCLHGQTGQVIKSTLLSLGWINGSSLIWQISGRSDGRMCQLSATRSSWNN